MKYKKGVVMDLYLPCVPRISICRCARPLAADRANLIMPSMVTE